MTGDLLTVGSSKSGRPRWPQVSQRTQSSWVSVSWGHCSVLSCPKGPQTPAFQRLGVTGVASSVPNSPDRGPSEDLGSLECPQLSQRTPDAGLPKSWGHWSVLNCPKLARSVPFRRLGVTVVSSSLPSEPQAGCSQQLGSLEWPQLSRILGPGHQAALTTGARRRALPTRARRAAAGARHRRSRPRGSCPGSRSRPSCAGRGSPGTGTGGP